MVITRPKIIEGRIFLVIIFMLAFKGMFAQDLYTVNTGHVSFASDAPLELIEAENESVQGVIQVLDRSFAFRVLMKNFEGFNSATQKTHFNTNYLETDTYKYTMFEGKIIEEIDLTTPGTYQVRGKGKFTCHGIKQERIIRCKLIVRPDGMTITTDFTVLLEDHNIKIPSVVNQKIAEEIQLELRMNLSSK